MRLIILSVSILAAGCFEHRPVFVTVDAGRDAGPITDSSDAGPTPPGSDAGPLPQSTCGNGIVERAAFPPEYCDDGNTNDADLCRNDCTRQCTAPAPPTCDEVPNDDCASAVCDPTGTESCQVVYAPPGTPCTSGAGCVGGVCTIASENLPCSPTLGGRCTFGSGADASAIASDGERLYWAEYGTFDALENYQYDGVIRAMPLGGGDIVTLAEGLEGPMELGVTSAHVYFSVDRHVGPDSALIGAVMRVPLAGGTAELIESGRHMKANCATCFVASGDHAYFPAWTPDGRALSILVSSAAGPTPTTFVTLPGTIMNMTSDGGYLYAQVYSRERLAEIYRVLLSGGESELIGDHASVVGGPFLATGGELIAVDREAYLARRPISGGIWVRFAQLVPRSYAAGLALVNSDRWVAGMEHSSATSSLIVETGSLSSNEVTELASDLPRGGEWIATSAGVFFVDFVENGAIQRVPY